MIVGLLTVDLAIHDAQSLKDKRRAILGLKQRMRSGFNVSVAEVAYHDLAKRCRLAVVMVARESRPLNSQLDQVVDLVRRNVQVTLVDYDLQML